MASASVTSYDALLKEIWPQTDIWDELYENAPLWAMLPKKTDWVGKKYHLGIGFGTTQGDGATFEKAQANKAPSSEAQFQLTTATYYSLFSIDRKLIRESRNDKGAIVAALDRQSTMAVKAWKRAQMIAVFRNHGGSVGKIAAAGIAGAVITLAISGDIINFEQNMTIEVASDDGSAAVPAGVRTGALKVLSVQRDISVATVTFTTTVAAGIPLAVAGDFIFKSGNYSQMLFGMPDWLPATAPVGGDSFFGLDRSKDPLRLAGIRKVVTGLQPREQLSSLAMEAFRNGAKPSHYFLNGDDYLNLQLELQSAGVLMMTKDVGAKIGTYSYGTPFEGIVVAGPGGPIKVFPDYQEVKGTGHMLQMNTWVLAGLGDFPYFDEQDGNRILREATADSYEGRIVGDFQLGCEAPGFNVAGVL